MLKVMGKIIFTISHSKNITYVKVHCPYLEIYGPPHKILVPVAYAQMPLVKAHGEVFSEPRGLDLAACPYVQLLLNNAISTENIVCLPICSF